MSGPVKARMREHDAHCRTGEDVELQRGEVLERVHNRLDEVDVGLQLVEDNVEDGDGEAVAELAEMPAGLLDVLGSQAPVRPT